MAKQIFFDETAKKTLRSGVDKAANAVGSTMGAAGKTVVISNHGSIPPLVTKDGVTVASSIILDDEIENIGAQMIRGASQKTAIDAGDGTTQTAVLAQFIIAEGLKSVSAEYSPQEIKIGMDFATTAIIDELKKMSTSVGDSNEKIKNIAIVSSNNDQVIGGLIAEAYQKIGNDVNGMLLIEQSGTIDTKIEVVDGFEIPRGYMSPHFVTDQNKMQAVYDGPLFLITDYVISTAKNLAPIFNELDKAQLLQNGLVIIAQDFEGEAYSTMIINSVKKNIRVVLVRAPGQYRKETLEDIAVLTGGTVIRDEAGLKLEDVKIEQLGRADKVIISEKFTRIIGGKGKKENIDALKNSVEVQIGDMKDEPLKEVWRRRLGQISGSIGVIKVGGSTDIEVREKMDRVDDACRAVKSAIEEGVVPGGGVALIRCQSLIFSLPGDQQIGADLIKKACVVPFLKMLNNAGIKDCQTHLTTVKNNAIHSWGYDIKNKQFGDMISLGIIDPTKVIRCALLNAVSIAGAVITSDVLIVEIAQK